MENIKKFYTIAEQLLPIVQNKTKATEAFKNTNLRQELQQAILAILISEKIQDFAAMEKEFSKEGKFYELRSTKTVANKIYNALAENTTVYDLAGVAYTKANIASAKLDSVYKAINNAKKAPEALIKHKAIVSEEEALEALIAEKYPTVPLKTLKSFPNKAALVEEGRALLAKNNPEQREAMEKACTILEKTFAEIASYDNGLALELWERLGGMLASEAPALSDDMDNVQAA